jgi:hypothetical protein
MIEALLRDGFAYHDTQSERLARELEAAAAGPVPAAQLVRFLHIANHTIGEHLGDWPRASALGGKALSGREPDTATAEAWGKLAAARFLAGDVAGATEAEMTAVRAARDWRTGYIDAKAALAVAMIGCGQIDRATPVYLGVLALARSGEGAHRGLAIASNNLASELLERPTRSPSQDTLMTLAADAAHEFWLTAGDWRNHERALYLRALVANALGDAHKARELADKALALIKAYGEAPIDETFLHLARANASAKLGEVEAHRHDLAIADKASQSWIDAGLKSWFAEERAKIATL